MSREAKSYKPICPLMSANDNGEYERCTKGECAWWVKTADEGRCAITILALNVAEQFGG